MKNLVGDHSKEQAELAEEFWQVVGLYLSPKEIEDVRTAHDFAYYAHSGQFRKSGHQYFFHLLNVAKILADLNASPEILAAGFLHDVVEDTSVLMSEIYTKFGPKVGYIVESATKFRGLETKTPKEKKTINLNRMVQVLEHHPEGLLVKLADRLHNVRTLSYFSVPVKRQRVAQETLEVYAPLAERLGVEVIKTELEDICFRELLPKELKRIEGILDVRKKLHANFRKGVRNKIEKIIVTMGYSDALVFEREKKPYSVWKKMVNKGIALKDIKDFYSLRVVLENPQNCYQLVKEICQKFKVLEGSFKDYIKDPKENGYQSLHLTVIDQDGEGYVDIQVRSKEMHQTASYGIAAHWLYKQDKKVFQNETNQEWVNSLLQTSLSTYVEKDIGSSGDKDVNPEQTIFCLTYTGELLSLPESSTVLDFAYAIKKETGDCCVGSKVNGGWASKETVLKNADQIQIITAGPQAHSSSLLDVVKTEKAKSSIEDLNKIHIKKKKISEGKVILQQYMNAFLGPYAYKEDAADYSEMVQRLGCKDIEEVYLKLSLGQISPADAVRAHVDNPEREDLAYIGVSTSVISCPKERTMNVKKKQTLDIQVLVDVASNYYSALEGCIRNFGGEIIEMKVQEKRQDFVEVLCRAEFQWFPVVEELERVIGQDMKLLHINFKDKEVV